MSNLRAELRRKQKAGIPASTYRAENVLFQNSVLKAEDVANATGTSLKLLAQWRSQEHNLIVEEVEEEYRAKLGKAEELIVEKMQAACVFAMFNTFFGLYKIKFNPDKIVTKYQEELDKAINHGIIDAARRAEHMTGLKFEFDDAAMNYEFHLGDWEHNKKISEMRPDRAYDKGYDIGSELSNIINTGIFADWLTEEGYTTEEVQKCVIKANKSAGKFRMGDGDFYIFLLGLKEKGIYLGDHAMEVVKKYGL